MNCVFSWCSAEFGWTVSHRAGCHHPVCHWWVGQIPFLPANRCDKEEFPQPMLAAFWAEKRLPWLGQRTPGISVFPVSITRMPPSWWLCLKTAALGESWEVHLLAVEGEGCRCSFEVFSRLSGSVTSWSRVHVLKSQSPTKGALYGRRVWGWL